MQFVQKPEPYSFAGNLKDIILSDITDTARVRLFETAIRVDLINEIYTPTADGTITIDIKSVITELMSSSIPALDVFICNPLERVRSFALYIDDISSVFTVLTGGTLGVSDTQLWESNFLTRRPSSRQINRESLEFLAYYAQEECKFNLRVEFLDGTELNHSVDLEYREYYSFNLSPAMLQRLFLRQPERYEAWIETYSGYHLTNTMVYVLSELDDNAQEYVYVNSLGAIDTIIFNGQHSRKAITTATLATIRNKTLESNIDLSVIYKQNTGYLTPVQSVLVQDFILAKEKYHLVSGRLIKIIIEESENEFINNTLNAGEFEYRHSEQSPYLNLSPPKSIQFPPHWDKVAACFDKKIDNRIIDRTRGYTATLLDDHIVFPELVIDAFNKDNRSFWLPGISGLREWSISDITGLKTIDYATDLCSRTLFFRDITDNKITSGMPIIVYAVPLNDDEIEEVLQYLKEYYFIEDRTDNALIVGNYPSEGNNMFLTDNSTQK